MTKMIEVKKAKDIVTFKTGKLDSNAAEEDGKYPFFTCSQETFRINSYAFDTECTLLAGNNAAGIFPLKYYKGKFNAYQRTYVIEPIDKAVLDIRYFYYYLRPLLTGFQQQATGATTKFLTLKILNNLDVWIPKIETQKKIAAILSAYDDLIENNKRRIALLEKMAEEIYREWFVRFRFPCYQNTEFEKGIPKGWIVRSLSEIAKINSSSLKKGAEPEFLDYVDIGSVTTNYIEETTTYHRNDAPGRARRIVKHGDIIWSSVRPANRAYSLIFRPKENLIVSTGFAVISPKNIEFYPFIYQAVTTNSYVDQITVVAKGAAYPATSFNDFEKSNILVPNDNLIKGYYLLCNPLYEQKHILDKQNKQLNQVKDLLLPRLISGKLSVENLDIQFPPSMLKDDAA